MSETEDQKYLHRSWSELGDFYISFSVKTTSEGFQSSLRALGKLCYAIEKTYLNDQLFAHTSHANLMICQTRTSYPPSFGAEYLVIKPLIDPALQFSIKHEGKGEGAWLRMSEPEELKTSSTAF